MIDLKLARQRQRITVEQAALMIDLSVSDYELAEAGKFDLSEAQLKKLAIFLRVDLQEKPPVKKKKKLSKQAREKRDRAQLRIDPEYVSEEDLEEARKTMPGITEESLRFLKLIAHLAVDITLKDLEQEKLLKATPGGFHPERSLPCKVCGAQVSGPEAWFDQNGQQCLSCYQAIKEGIIPADLHKNQDHFYDEIELDIYFKLSRKMINQLIKEKHLVARKIGHQRLFLHQDNPNFFPPKELLKGGVIQTETEYIFPPWYKLTDPNEHLKPYGIGRLLKWDFVKNEK